MPSTKLMNLIAVSVLAASAGCETDSSPEPPRAAPRDTTTRPAPATAPAAAPLAIVARSVMEGEVTVVTLSNGMVLIVKPTRTAPVVTVKCYVRTGALYEGRWLGCGLSHLLEHLVAGDATHSGQEPGKAPTDRVTQIGGQSNASTSKARTCYYISAAASKSDQCIDLVVDWLARPKFTAEDFEREHGVVQREMEKGKDEPNRSSASPS